jgi:hypothetical protein
MSYCFIYPYILFCVVLQNNMNVNIVCFQYSPETGCSIKRNCLYVSLQVTEKNELNFPFDNVHNTQRTAQVNNWAI